jgi:phosphoribosyl 1,2-cyclic phosphodiesterase
LGVSLSNLTAAIITHAHTDHINAAGWSFLHKNRVPIYMHEKIFEDASKKCGSKIKKYNVIYFQENFNVKDICIKSFDVYHKDKNISKTLGFIFSSTLSGREYKIGYVTDTGKICDKIIKNLVNSNILVIESNYNWKMLNSSFRTYGNKKWISSDWGHLANEEAANAIAKIKMLSKSKDSLKYIFLIHISVHHNTHELALDVVKKTLLNKKILDVNVFVAKRRQKSPTIKIK